MILAAAVDKSKRKVLGLKFAVSVLKHLLYIESYS